MKKALIQKIEKNNLEKKKEKKKKKAKSMCY
jgi:hypothetical protein